jgi:hypothetical protein
MLWLDDVVEDLAMDVIEDPVGRALEAGLTHAVEAAGERTLRQTARSDAAAQDAMHARSSRAGAGSAGPSSAETALMPQQGRQARFSMKGLATAQTISSEGSDRRGRVKLVPRREHDHDYLSGGGSRGRRQEYADLDWDEVEEVQPSPLLAVASRY